MGSAFLIALGILALLVGGYLAFNAMLARRVARRHDSPQDAAADAGDPIPSTHLVADDETPAGDTPEAHDEINPHDLPKDHPGRQTAEEQAGGMQGTTRGGTDAPAR
jgi:hypothetical protein